MFDGSDNMVGDTASGVGTVAADVAVSALELEMGLALPVALVVAMADAGAAVTDAAADAARAAWRSFFEDLEGIAGEAVTSAHIWNAWEFQKHL